MFLTMKENELIPHLFRTEYRKIVSVLCYLFGIEHIETAEDIVSDTFLSPQNYGARKVYLITRPGGYIQLLKTKPKTISNIMLFLRRNWLLT